MRLLAEDHAYILLDRDTWLDNPFFWREVRRDRARKQPGRSVAWMAAIMALAILLSSWGLLTLIRIRWRGFWVFGGSSATAAAIVIAGVHGLFICTVSQRHATRLFLDEASRHSLPQLLLLPISRFQIVVQGAAYGWWAGMRSALALLPMYVALAATGGLSPADLVGLYMVFALWCLNPPQWNRPALSEDVGIIQPVRTTAAVQGGSAAVWGARRIDRPPVFGGWVMAAGYVAVGAWVSNRMSLAATYWELHRYLPRSLILLLPTSFISAPLLLARGLFTPLEWFRYPLPPIIPAGALFLLGRYLLAVRTSEWLQVSRHEELELLPTWEGRHRWVARQRWLMVFVAAGYLWPLLVRDGGLASFTGFPAAYGARGLAAFAWLCLAGALLAGALPNLSQIAKRAWARRKPAAAGVAAAAATCVLLPIAQGLALYSACCLAAWTPPFSGRIAVLALQLAAVGAAAQLLRLAVWRSGSWSTVLGVLVPAAAVALHSVPQYVALGPVVNALMACSPAMALVSFVSRAGSSGVASGLLPPALPWWTYPAVQAALAGGLGAAILGTELARAARERWRARRRASRQARQRERATAAAAGTDQPSAIALWLAGAVDRATDNAVAVKELRVRLRRRLKPATIVQCYAVCLLGTLALYATLEQLKMGFNEALAVLVLWGIAVMAAALVTGVAVLPGMFAEEQEKSTLGFLLTTPISDASLVGGKVCGLVLASSPVLVLAWTCDLWATLCFGTQAGWQIAAPLFLGVTVGGLLMTLLAASLFAAIASIWPRRITAAFGSVLIIVMVEGGVFGIQYVVRYLSSLDIDWSVHSVVYVAAMAAGDVLLSGLLLTFTALRVQAMRHGDVLFKSGRRDG